MLRISYLLGYQPRVLRDRSRPYVIRLVKQGKVELVENLDVIPLFFSVYGSNKPYQVMWKQIVLLESRFASVFFLADYLDPNRFRDIPVPKEYEEYEGMKYRLLLNNVMYLVFQYPRKYKLLRDVVELCASGKVSGRRFYIPVFEYNKIREGVRKFLDDFIGVMLWAKEALREYQADVRVRVFCDCPFFRYWGAYYQSMKKRFGLESYSAARLFDSYGIAHHVFEKYKVEPKGRVGIVSVRVGPVSPFYVVKEGEKIRRERGIRILYRREKKVVSPFERSVLGYKWGSFYICKHLYKALEDHRGRLYEVFYVYAKDLSKEVEEVVNKAIDELKKFSKRKVEYIEVQPLTKAVRDYIHIVNHMLDSFYEQGNVDVNVQDMLVPGTAWILQQSVVVPKFIGATQSKSIRIPANARIYFCCKLRGPEPPFYRFVAEFSGKKVEIDLPEPEIMIILKHVKPEIKQWRGIYTPEPVGWALGG